MHPPEIDHVAIYLIYYIDEGLNITPAEAVNRFGCLLVREDCLDKGGEFILRGGMADQALPPMLMGVERDRWIGGTVLIPCITKRR